jgi:hypothetical protein
MSSEERITKIENVLTALTEGQVHFQAQAEARHAKADAEMAELRQLSKASDERLDRHIEFVTKAITQAEQQISRTAAAQEVTEQQLQKFISDADDRFGKLERKKP